MDVDDSSIDSLHEDGVSSDDERNRVNINDLDREVLASRNKSDEDREDGGKSFFQHDVEYGEECSEFQGAEVFDNESCPETPYQTSENFPKTL